MNNFYPNPMYPPATTYMARQEIVRVNGENGARAFQMAPMNAYKKSLGTSSGFLMLIRGYLIREESKGP